MKKLLYASMAVLGLALVSCDKDEPGATATVEMSGEWYVTFDGADSDGNVVWEDPFGMGRCITFTSNTAANTATEIWVGDNGVFWEYQVKATCDLSTLTFATNGFADNAMYDSTCKITGGKIVKNGATTPRGMPADYIEYYIIFDDDPYISYGYWDQIKVSGWRYTGFVDDEE